jgi:hypothetical protein
MGKHFLAESGGRADFEGENPDRRAPGKKNARSGERA